MSEHFSRAFFQKIGDTYVRFSGNKREPRCFGKLNAALRDQPQLAANELAVCSGWKSRLMPSALQLPSKRNSKEGLFRHWLFL
jgi:hypothetical protein